jgi:hypothetical protein
MTTIARCGQHIPVLAGEPITIPVTEYNPPAPDGDGSPIDHTGSVITAVLLPPGQNRKLTVTQPDPTTGKFTVNITGNQTADLSPANEDPRVQVTIRDSLGVPRVYIYPLSSVHP